MTVSGSQIAASRSAGASPLGGTGFSEPFAGTPKYVHLAPTEVQASSQLNQPIGPRVAAEIAKELGLNKADVFTPEQYAEFVTGGGIGGNLHDASLADQSVRILTNTVGRPLYSKVDGRTIATVLASYGLFVNKVGLLESPANWSAPTRRINKVIAPGGYFNRWCLANGATRSLTTLYKSGYTLETLYGYVAQHISGKAQLITNTEGGVSTEVGMSMGPALWLVNFALAYTLNPSLAADMPARWAPIPTAVADALLHSPTGQVPYSRYASYFG